MPYTTCCIRRGSYTNRQILYWIAITSIVIGEFPYLIQYDKPGFLKFFLTVFGFVLEPFVPCFFNNIQKLLVCCFCCWVGSEVSESSDASPSQFIASRDCCPVMASCKYIILTIVIDLAGIFTFCAVMETQPFTHQNVMLILGVIALGTLLKRLIFTKDSQEVKFNGMTLSVTMYMICWKYFKTLQDIQQRFSRCNLLTASGDPVPEKLIFLVSPHEMDKNLHQYDPMIEESIIEPEGFPIYSWLYSNERYSYAVLQAEEPLKMIQHMCHSDLISHVHTSDLNKQMKIFFNAMKTCFLKNSPMSIKLIPVFVDFVDGRMPCGWLVDQIMESIRQHQTQSIGDQSSSNHLPLQTTATDQNETLENRTSTIASQLQHSANIEQSTLGNSNAVGHEIFLMRQNLLEEIQLPEDYSPLHLQRSQITE